MEELKRRLAEAEDNSRRALEMAFQAQGRFDETKKDYHRVQTFNIGFFGLLFLFQILEIFFG